MQASAQVSTAVTTEQRGVWRVPVEIYNTAKTTAELQCYGAVTCYHFQTHSSNSILPKRHFSILETALLI